MKNTKFTPLLIALILSIASYETVAHSVHSDERIKFRLLDRNYIVVPVTVNGEGPFDFLVDLGTDTTLIETDLAEKMHLQPIDRIYLTTVSGTQAFPRSKVDELAIGPNSVKDAEVLISDLHEVRKLDRKLSGVLGQPFFANFNFVLSYADNSLEFPSSGEGQLACGEQLPFEISDGKIIVTARTSSGDLRMVLDSGIPDIVLFGSAARNRFVKVDLENAVGIASSLVGQASYQSGTLPFLHFGRRTFKNLPVVVVTLKESDQRGEDGLLPTNMFSTVFVNNASRYVVLDLGRMKFSCGD
jgi:predicted aspartyl protease